MARIENRSRFIVTVKNRGDLSKTFPFDATDAVKAYIADLTAQKFKPKASRLNDTYLVRFRAVGHPDMNLTVGSEEEAAELEQRIESERRTGLFIDYTKGWKYVSVRRTHVDHLRRSCLTLRCRRAASDAAAVPQCGWPCAWAVA